MNQEDGWHTFLLVAILAGMAGMAGMIWNIDQRIPEPSNLPVLYTYETHIESIPDVTVLTDTLTTAELLKTWIDNAQTCTFGQELVDVIATEGKEHVFDDGTRTPTIELVFVCKENFDYGASR